MNAKTTTTELRRESTEDVDIDRSEDFGIWGLLSVLARGNASGSIYVLSEYTTQQLVTMANQCKNIGETTSNALSAVASMMMNHDVEAGDFNHVGVGGLVELLADMGQSAAVIETNAIHELEQRGYSASGKYLAAAKAA